MIPWIIVAVRRRAAGHGIAFVVARRDTAAGELLAAGETTQRREQTESEFRAAEHARSSGTRPTRRRVSTKSACRSFLRRRELAHRIDSDYGYTVL